MPAGHIPGLNLSDYGFIVSAVGRTETVLCSGAPSWRAPLL